MSPGGVLLALAAGLGYASYTVIAKQLLAAGHSPQTVMGGAFGAGGLLLAPVLVVTAGPWLFTAGGVALVLYLALVPTALAYVLFARGLQQLTAGETATLTLAEPLTAALLGAVVLGERPGAVAVAGAGMVLAGLLALASRPPGARDSAARGAAPVEPVVVALGLEPSRRPADELCSAPVAPRSRLDGQRAGRGVADAHPRRRAPGREPTAGVRPHRRVRRRPPQRASRAAGAGRPRAWSSSNPTAARASPRLDADDVLGLYALRGILEVGAAEIALERGEGRLPAPVHAAAQAFAALCCSRDPPAWSRVVVAHNAVHAAIVAAAGIPAGRAGPRRAVG